MIPVPDLLRLRLEANLPGLESALFAACSAADTEWRARAHFAGAYAKGQSAKCSVGAGVAIAADDCNTWTGQAEFWSNDMDDALFGGINIEKRDTRLCAIRAQGLNLFCCDQVGNRQTAIVVGTLWSAVAQSSQDGAHDDQRPAAQQTPAAK